MEKLLKILMFGNLMATASDNPFGSPEGAGEGLEEDFSIDLPEDKGFRIKAGKYPGKLISLDKGTSKAGNPMWIFTFVILAGEAAGKEFRVYAALTAAAMWKLRETLEGLGLGKGGAVSSFKKKDAVGKLVKLTIEDTEYNGKPNSQISLVEPLKPEEEAQAVKDAASLASKGDMPTDSAPVKTDDVPA